jgi:hypothetical protein
MYCGGGHLEFSIDIGPYGKNVSKRFFSKTTWIIETKLPMNVHWMVLYKLYVFCFGIKFKMASTAGFEIHIGTKNVEFVEDHPMNIHVQFGFNHICSF